MPQLEYAHPVTRGNVNDAYCCKMTAILFWQWVFTVNQLC